MDAAVAAARAALRGPWGRMSEQERAAVLRRVADELERRFDDLVAAEVADTGKPSPRRAPSTSRAARRTSGPSRTSWRPRRPSRSRSPRRAAGAQLRRPQAGRRGRGDRAVEPAAAAAHLEGRAGPACGNAVVVKPSEETPASATLLAEVMARAGVPEGVFNLVHGFGPGLGRRVLTRHPGVDAITFTGESATGSAICSASRTRSRRCRSSWAARTPGWSSPTPTWTPRSTARCGRRSPTAARSACAPSGCTSSAHVRASS